MAPPFVVPHSAARVIHALLPLLLVGLGALYCPEGREAYLSSFAALFALIGTTVLLAAGAFDAAGALCCRRLQAHKTEAKMRGMEAFETVRAACVFASLAAWPRARFLAGKPTAVVFTLAEAQPEAPDSVALYALKLALVTLLVDAYMYFKHRLLHSRPLWAFHAGHHAFHNPSPFASFAVAPVEALLTFWPVTLLSFREAPILGQAYAAWVAGFVLLNLYLHAGHTSAVAEAVLRPVGLNSSDFHNVHHERTVQNFGELMYVWDWMLGTGEHPGGAGRKGKGE